MLDRIKTFFRGSQVSEDLSRKYKEVFQGPKGKEVLDDILKSCSIHEVTYVPGHDSASAFNEGRRSVGLRLLRLVEAEFTNQKIIEENND